MITTRELTTKEDFENLKKGDKLACEFHEYIRNSKGPCRFGIFEIFLNKSQDREIILQKKNNIYFNYEMFLNGNSSLKHVVLISCGDLEQNKKIKNGFFIPCFTCLYPINCENMGKCY